MRLHDFSRRAENDRRPALPLDIPLCALCGNEGFTGCPDAIVENGTLIAVALRNGVACSCPAGAEFAQWQMEYLR